MWKLKRQPCFFSCHQSKLMHRGATSSAEASNLQDTASRATANEEIRKAHDMGL